MSRLRVVHVMESTIGGTRRHLRDVARLQQARGLDVHVIAATLREPRVEDDLRELEACGVHVERLQMRRSIAPWSDARHTLWLARRLRALSPDVVHTHSSKAGVLGRLASMTARRGARVHTPHTFAFLFEAMFSAKKRALFRAIERRLALHTDAVVAVSTSEAATIAASGVVPRDRLRVVSNGIAVEGWLDAAPLDRSTFGFAPGRALAVVAGLFNVAKGQDLALEMLQAAGCERLDLVFAGDGETRIELERRARELGLAERTRFLGWRDDLPRVFATADCVLLPSRWEGLPYVVLEAFAVGRPVVATPVDGARELVVEGRTGALASGISAEELAAAMARFLGLTRSERDTLGRAGRELVLANYTAERMVDGLIAVYTEVA